MRKRGPWTILSSAEAYRNPWIKVDEHSVLRPDGSPGIYGTVEMQAGISVVAFDEADSRLLLTQEFKFAVGRTSIELVSGGIEPGETPEESAVRELDEELGAVVRELRPLITIDPFTSVVSSPNHIFQATCALKRRPHADPTEQIQLVKMSLPEALDMIRLGEISHGATVAGILGVALQRDQKDLS